MASWFLVAACADRFICSSRNANTRRFSSIKNTHRVVPITILLAFMAYFHMPIYFKIAYSSGNDCWYRTNSMLDVGPFPISWLNGVENYIQIYPWYPLPPNLINKGEEWIPELQLEL
ncbi:unnamed protein product [Adineta steineri]|uniref:Uncharacterized protein n=1 Tax=Adineta steineri TaxID=433720 RepID=A0A819GFV2_9BILA|nr:unnamed protein product [Adineta steineri]